MKTLLAASAVMLFTGALGHGINYADKFEQAQECKIEVAKTFAYARNVIEAGHSKAEQFQQKGPVSDLARAYLLVKHAELEKIRKAQVAKHQDAC